MERDTFVFYREWLEGLEDFDIEFKWKILDAVFEYALNGILPTDPIILFSPFAMIRKRIDKDNEKYQSVVLRNQLNGVKGGRPRKEKIFETQKTQPNPKNPVGFEKPKKPTETQITQKTQPNPKNLDNDNDNDNDIVSEYKYSSTIISEPKGSVSTDVAVDPQNRQNDEDLNEIVKEFNLAVLGRTIPQIQKVTDKRKSALRARIKDYGRQALFDVIRKAAESNFLNGDNNRGWKADFDWIFRPNNFPKILEGNYDNTRPNNTYGTTSGYASDAVSQAEQRNEDFMQHIYAKINGNQGGHPQTLWQ